MQGRLWVRRYQASLLPCPARCVLTQVLTLCLTGVTLKVTWLHSGLLWEEPRPILQESPPLFLSKFLSGVMELRVVGPGVASV